MAGRHSFSRWLGQTVLRISGWKIRGEIPIVPKMVIIVAPHTSNWDFIIGMAGRLALQLQASWLGKHTIFFWPLRPLLLRLGGIPVNRDSAQGVVEDVAQLFRAREKMILGLSPEGTRSRVENWKSGFYRIALSAEVPILLIAFDYGTKTILIGDLLYPSGDLQQDFLKIRDFYSKTRGRHPEKFALPAPEVEV